MIQHVVASFFLLVVMFSTDVHAADALTRREWKVDGAAREALVHVPKDATAKLAPVVFAFHGHGGTMQNAARMFRIHQLWPEALVVYMQGLNTPGQLTDPEGKKPGWQRRPGDQKDRDLIFFDIVLKSLKQDYKVNTNRVYATGHSNGGAFSYLLWQTRGEQFAAFAPSASLLAFGRHQGTAPVYTPGAKSQSNPSGIFPEPSVTRTNESWLTLSLPRKPILHLAGTNDPLVKFQWQELFLNTLRKRNECANGTPWEHDKRCTIYRSKQGGDVITYIHQGGHKYPDEAPELVVKFFKGISGK